MPAHSDTVYITAICKNDRLKTLEIYKKCFPNVDQYIRQNSGSLTDAKDIFQEAIIDLYTRACLKKDFTLTTSICSFLGYVSKMKWLKALSKNKSTNALRTQLKGEYKDVVVSLEDKMIQAEAQIELKKKLADSFAQLSERCQALLQLEARGFSTEEIIEQMNFSNRNVLDASKSRCYRKWRALYLALDEKG